ncbi:MAG: TraB/GumN family protein [Pseudomonadota bacterium]
MLTRHRLYMTVARSAAIVLTGLLTACGGEGDTAPEATDEPASAVIAEGPANALEGASGDVPRRGPALWKVEDDDTTVYLFGTFHALKPGTVWFEGPVREAYESADEVALEATDAQDADLMQSLVMRYAVDPDGRRLSEVIGPELTEQLDDRLAELSIPRAGLEPMEPWMAVMTLAQVQMMASGFDPTLGVDLALQAAATEAGKSLVGIEGAEAQLRMLDSFPPARQVAWLAISLRDWDESEGALNDMLAYWKAGDVPAFGAEMFESMEEVPDLNEVLIVERNRGFADWIVSRMARPGVVFVAIGAGHLAGEDSVQNFLRDDGLTPARL